MINHLSNSKKESDQKAVLTILAQYYTSLRHSDLKQITIGDILTKNKIQIIETKTHKAKDIYINDEFKRRVKDILKDTGINLSSNFNFYSIQHLNRLLKKYKFEFKLINSDGDSDFNFSTHSIRKCSLYEIYVKAGINTSLAISNHSTIKIHLKYICMNEDVKNAYNSL